MRRGLVRMQSFAEWLTASRARALAGAVLLALLGSRILFLAWLPGALVVLLALRQAARAGAPARLEPGGAADAAIGTTPAAPLGDATAALVAGAVFALMLAGPMGPVPAVLLAAALVLPALLLGRLLARGGTLKVAFQLATLGVLVALVGVHVVLADPPGVWRPFTEWLATELVRVGIVISDIGTDGSPESVAEATAARMWGVVGWLLLLNTMVTAFVGLYWSGLIRRRPVLGPEFRRLAAGRTLALVAVVTTVLSVAFGWGLPADAVSVFLGAFLLQGLAVLHAARDAAGLGTGWLVGAYVLLFLPVTTLFASTALTVTGFVDNWFPLRERFAARRGTGGG